MNKFLNFICLFRHDLPQFDLEDLRYKEVAINRESFDLVFAAKITAEKIVMKL